MIAARAIGDALRAALNEDDRVILLGEDLVDPYGGAFKVTRGLSTDFPGRVRSTPISEGAIAGLSAGLALSGYRPIAEIMFGDFLTLCFDQIVNHIAKYEAMYNGKVTCPVIIRTPSGGGRGYGPTHSQSLEKHFLGVPHLRVVASSLVHDPAAVLRALLAQNSPVLLIEHKLLYPLHLMLPAGGRIEGDIAEEHVSADGLPTVSIRPVPREDCWFTVLAYGYQAELARRVLSRLAVEEEIFGELVVPSQISPLEWEPIDASVSVTRSLLVIEEGVEGFTWGSEVAARISCALLRQAAPPGRHRGERPHRDSELEDARGRNADDLGARRASDPKGGRMKPVLVPTTDVNSETGLLLTWHVGDRSKVEAGETIAEIETSKAIIDVPAPEAGFLLHAAREGAEVRLTEPVARLFADVGALEAYAEEEQRRRAEAAGSGPRATEPARRRAEELGVDLASIGGGSLITVGMVEAAAAAATTATDRASGPAARSDGTAADRAGRRRPRRYAGYRHPAGSREWHRRGDRRRRRVALGGRGNGRARRGRLRAARDAVRRGRLRCRDHRHLDLGPGPGEAARAYSQPTASPWPTRSIRRRGSPRT